MMSNSDKLDDLINKYKLDRNKIKFICHSDFSITPPIWFISLKINNIKLYEHSILKNQAISNIIDKLTLKLREQIKN